MYGKTLAFSLDRPLLGVNHLEGHLFAPTLEDPELAPPFVGAAGERRPHHAARRARVGRVPAAGADARRRRRRGVRQGGQAARPRLSGRRRRSSGWRARDSPAASAFPGRCCQELDRDGPNRYAFSFSGLKTAVLRAVRPTPAASRPPPSGPADVARGFQDAAIDVLVAKTAHAVEALGYSAGDDRRRRGLQPRAGRRGCATGWRDGPG